MKGRNRTGLSLLLTISLIVGACGGNGDNSRGGAGTVTFLTFGNPEELQAYRNVIAEYERRQPGANVELVEASDREDLLARLSTSFAGGNPPDLFLVNYRYYAQFAAKRLLEPVEDRVASSTAFKLDDFYPQALDAFRFGGRLMCMPQNISSLVVYYNRSLFQQAGVADPESGWTWDDMVNSAKALTKGDQHGLGVDPEIIRVAPFVWSNEGRLVDSPEKPSRFMFEERASMTALEEFLDLHRVDGVVPDEPEVAAEENESRFQNGRLGMFMSSRRSTPTFREITEFDWDVAPLPQLDDPASVLHSDAYCMTVASEQKDAAWRFVEFAVGPEGQRITSATGRTVPSLISVSTSPAFLDPDAKPASSRVFIDTIPFIHRLPVVSTWPEIEDAANTILEDGFYSNQPVAFVAEEIVETTLPLFARAQY